MDGIGNGTQLDWFEFEASKNEAISFEVIANRLGSNFDPAVRVYEASGRLASFGTLPVSHRICSFGIGSTKPDATF